MNLFLERKLKHRQSVYKNEYFIIILIKLQTYLAYYPYMKVKGRPLKVLTILEERATALRREHPLLRHFQLL